MSIYLDVDGVLLNHDGTLANHLRMFGSGDEHDLHRWLDHRLRCLVE
jgi:hypothetical protein